MSTSLEVTIETYDGPAAVLTGELRDLYAAVYAEPPYRDGPAELAEFAAEWPGLVARDGFRLALAILPRAGAAPDRLAGFALGHTVGPDSGWWPAGHLAGGAGYRLVGPAPHRPPYRVMCLDRDTLHSGPPPAGLRPDPDARIMDP